MWHELALDGASAEEALNTPARIPWQTRLIDEVVQREGFGADDVPDLLYINYKLIDEIGHALLDEQPRRCANRCRRRTPTCRT